MCVLTYWLTGFPTTPPEDILLARALPNPMTAPHLAVSCLSWEQGVGIDP